MDSCVNTLISQMKRLKVHSRVTAYAETEIVVHNNIQRFTLPIATPTFPIAPCNMKKYSSTNDLIAISDDKDLGQLPLIRRTVTNDILLLLPTMIDNILQNQYTWLSTPGNGTSTPSTQFDKEIIDNLRKEIDELKLFKKNAENKFEGYAKKVKAWTTAVTDCKMIVNNLSKMWTEHKKSLAKQEKNITTKTKEYTKTETRMKAILNECESKKNELTTQIENMKIGDKQKIKDIDESQTFVSHKYDELLQELGDVKKRLAKNIEKTEQNNKYPRRDCLEVKEVPVILDEEGKENCKNVVIEICKELHLWLPEMSISTAHRLKQHPDQIGRPPIIVKFVSRDIRNDVYQLRHQIKEKKHWRLFGMQQLYINEHLSPETKKLVYKTKVFSREMERIEGKMFVWTFKGDVYLRKDAAGAPKIKITSELDLKKKLEVKYHSFSQTQQLRIIMRSLTPMKTCIILFQTIIAKLK